MNASTNSSFRSVTFISYGPAWTCSAGSGKAGKGAKPCQSKYGHVMEDDAVDDEEFPPLPKEGDVKRIKEEHPDGELEIVQEEKEDVKEEELDAAQEDTNKEDLARVQEEIEAIDAQAEDEEELHTASDDEEEISDYVLEDAYRNLKETAVWENKRDEL